VLSTLHRPHGSTSEVEDSKQLVTLLMRSNWLDAGAHTGDRGPSMAGMYACLHMHPMYIHPMYIHLLKVTCTQMYYYIHACSPLPPCTPVNFVHTHIFLQSHTPHTHIHFFPYISPYPCSHTCKRIRHVCISQ